MFKIGNVVKLKAGGPQMTVASFDDEWEDGAEGAATKCQWFDHRNQLETGFFNSNMLELIKE